MSEPLTQNGILIHGRGMKTTPLASIQQRLLGAQWLILVHRIWLKEEYVQFNLLFCDFDPLNFDRIKLLTSFLFVYL